MIEVLASAVAALVAPCDSAACAYALRTASAKPQEVTSDPVAVLPNEPCDVDVCKHGVAPTGRLADVPVVVGAAVVLGAELVAGCWAVTAGAAGPAAVAG